MNIFEHVTEFVFVWISQQNPYKKRNKTTIINNPKLIYMNVRICTYTYICTFIHIALVVVAVWATVFFLVMHNKYLTYKLTLKNHSCYFRVSVSVFILNLIHVLWTFGTFFSLSVSSLLFFISSCFHVVIWLWFFKFLIYDLIQCFYLIIIKYN